MAYVDMEHVNLNPNDNPEEFKKGCELAKKELEKLIGKFQKKSTEKHTDLFTKKDGLLKEYDSREEIEEAYGWDFITKAERDQLLLLWDVSESKPMPEDFALVFFNRCMRDLQDFMVYELNAHKETI